MALRPPVVNLLVVFASQWLDRCSSRIPGLEEALDRAVLVLSGVMRQPYSFYAFVSVDSAALWY